MSEVPLPSVDNPPYPKEFFAAALQGNDVLPQMHILQTARGGASVVREIRNGLYTWRDFLHATPSEKQMDQLRTSVFWNHYQHGIPVLPSGISPELRQKFEDRYPGRRITLVSDDSIRTTIPGIDKRNVIGAATSYAKLVIPAEEQPESDLSERQKAEFRFSGLEIIERFQTQDHNIPLLNVLFTDPKYSEAADTLVSLWEEADRCLVANKRVIKGLSVRLKTALENRDQPSYAAYIEAETRRDLYPLMIDALSAKFTKLHPDVITKFLSFILA